MQKLIGNESQLFIVDEFTGEMYSWNGITSIDELSLEDENEEVENEVIGRLFNEISFSCELEISPEQEKLIRDLLLSKPRKKLGEICDDAKKPNPVYVPKHIAKRRKW